MNFFIPEFTLALYSPPVSTLEQIAASYGVEYVDLARFVGIEGVDPTAELNEGQTSLVVQLIEAGLQPAGGGAGRHRF